MNSSILVVRIVMMIFCVSGGFLVSYIYPDIPGTPWLPALVGLLIGLLLLLVDILLKGFSLRGLSALTVGLVMGIVCAHFISISPLFEGGDERVIYISRLCVFVLMTYLGAVIALRGKDEFNLVIPYVKFEPESVEVPLIVLDTSSLVDGRVSKLAKARLLSDVLLVPKFVVDELHELGNSQVEEERNRGKRGLKTISELRELDQIDLRIYDSEVDRKASREEKMLFIVTSLKGRLLSTSESVINKARHDAVPFVDMLSLSKALTHEVVVGEAIRVRLVKMGKEDGQGVGYLEDGSMVVVNGGMDFVGSLVLVEVESIIPTSGGRMVFAKLLGEEK